MESVKVLEEPIIRNWEDMGVLRIIFESSLPDDEAVVVLERARGSLALPSGPLVSPGGVAASLQGPVVTIHGVADGDQARILLSGMGRAIADQGVPGVIRAVPRISTPLNNPAADMSGFVAGMCLRGRPDVEFPTL